MAAMQQAFASEIGQATAADVSEFSPTGVSSLVFEVERV